MNTDTNIQMKKTDFPTVNVSGFDQCLTFKLADEEYGVDIMSVQEIRSWEPVTRLPNTPEFVTGVINLRGIVVPIIDLRKRFNLDTVAYGTTTVVVVVKVETGDSERTMGMVVDAVSEVYNLSQDIIRKAPELGSAISMEYIRGLADIDEKMIILLDVDTMLNLKELQVRTAVN